MSHTRHINIPVFIPHLGCTHACVFCDQRKISGANSYLHPDRVKRLLDKSMKTIDENSEVEIAFFGGSFTAMPESVMTDYLEVVRPYITQGQVRGIRISTRPDAITPHILDILEQYGVTAIELGAQSLDEEVLKLCKRGHTALDVRNASKLIKSRNFSLGIQIMLGLPGDSFEKTMNTAFGVTALKPDMARLYPALVIKGTELETMYKNGEYTPLSLEDAVEWCARITPLFRESGINVLRMGLQDSDSLRGSILAGPYHPAFGELVESRILYRKMDRQLEALGPLGNERIIIKTRPSLLSKVVGQKRSNFKSLKRKYGLQEIIAATGDVQNDFEIQKILKGVEEDRE